MQGLIPGSSAPQPKPSTKTSSTWAGDPGRAGVGGTGVSCLWAVGTGRYHPPAVQAQNVSDVRRGAKPRGGHAVSGRRLDSILSIVEWMRVDVVAILVMVLLPELGLVRATYTFSGLSSNAVVEKVCELKDLRQ